MQNLKQIYYSSNLNPIPNPDLLFLSADVGSRINPRPPPLPRFAIPIHEYECKREKEGKLGKEIKDKRVGGSADKAGIETPILDDALIMQGSSMQ